MGKVLMMCNNIVTNVQIFLLVDRLTSSQFVPVTPRINVKDYLCTIVNKNCHFQIYNMLE